MRLRKGAVGHKYNKLVLDKKYDIWHTGESKRFYNGGA